MATRLDEALPKWQFAERHAIEVAAPPDRVFAAIRAVTAGEIFLFRTLTTLRRLGRPLPESILNAPKDTPLLDVALRGGFFVMADDPPHEIVIAMYVIPPKRALAAMNFAVTSSGHGSHVTTETRVYASDAAARRRFALYWFAIRLGSGFIRRMWLRAIRKRAEGLRPGLVSERPAS